MGQLAIGLGPLGANGPLLLEAPPPLAVGPPPSPIPASIMQVEEEEECPSHSQKKRKFDRVSDWPVEWREKYEAWKAAMKDREKPRERKSNLGLMGQGPAEPGLCFKRARKAGSDPAVAGRAGHFP